ncbi:MAG: hypothetical protein WBM09_02550 [Gallionella sp.]
MGLSFKVLNIAVGICLAISPGVVYADDTAGNIVLPTAASFYTDDFQSLKSPSFDSNAYLLAANEGGAVQKQADATPAAEFKPPLMSGRKAHEYLGLGTLALFGLTAITAPDDERNNTQPQNSGTHHSLGRATAAMAAATVVTGLLFHWDDFHFEDGFADPDNLHVMLAGAGALAMLYAVSVAPAHNHSSAGIAGGAAMIVAVKLTW